MYSYGIGCGNVFTPLAFTAMYGLKWLESHEVRCDVILQFDTFDYYIKNHIYTQYIYTIDQIYYRSDIIDISILLIATI